MFAMIEVVVCAAIYLPALGLGMILGFQGKWRGLAFMVGGAYLLAIAAITWGRARG